LKLTQNRKKKKQVVQKSKDNEQQGQKGKKKKQRWKPKIKTQRTGVFEIQSFRLDLLKTTTAKTQITSKHANRDKDNEVAPMRLRPGVLADQRR